MNVFHGNQNGESFPKSFQLTLLRPIKGINHSLIKMYFLNHEIWKSKWLLDLWAAEWILCKQAWKPLIPLSISIRALRWPGVFSKRAVNILKYFFFFFSWTVGLNNELKIFSKPCCKQMYWHPGFVIPLIEHRQSGFSKILTCSKIFRMINKY